MAVIGKHGAAANVGDTGQTFPPVVLVCSNDIITQQTKDALYCQNVFQCISEYSHTPCWNRNLIAPKDPFAPLWILIEEHHSISGFEY